VSSRVRRWAARRAGTAKPPSASAYWRSSRSNVLARPGVRELSRSPAWHTQITRSGAVQAGKLDLAQPSRSGTRALSHADSHAM
jgi:hypothetical protein